MSGFEIAGVILGVIPLIISALENYQTGKGIAASIINWKGLLQDLIFRLKLQRKIFYLDILELMRSAQVSQLSGTIDPTEEQCVMILRSIENSQETRRYFGSFHDTFLDILRRYETCLKTVAGKINRIHRPAGCPKDDLAALIDANPTEDGGFQFRRRIQFAISRRSLSDLVGQLHEDRLSLKMVIQGMKNKQEWIVKQASSSARRLADRFAQVQRNAALVCIAIRQGYTCNCADHRIFLRLQNRLLLYSMGGLGREGSTSFDLVFDLGGQLQDAVIETSETSSIDASTSTDQSQSNSTYTTTASLNAPTIQVIPVEGPKRQNPQGKVINVCVKAREASSSGIVLTLKATGNELSHKDGTISQKKSYSAQKSLNTFLQDNFRDEDARLTPKQQTMLSLDVAASVLQLHETSWCQSPFDSSAIQLLFHHSIYTQKVTSEPFVEQLFQDTRMSHTALQGPNPKLALLELAILLLEIWHHKTFEMWATGAGISDITSADGRMIAAMKWLQTTHERLPLHHLTAIEKCLALYSGRLWRWEDDEFRRLFCENVVKPLEENCRAW
ncbi:hypothetical protein F5B21DRAFT_455242 [Xylaria acuta]|nr:hypothetical protein F5B21DRAFT_455242 [Xylaria acuta]